MKVHITTYALTQGILELEAELCEKPNGDLKGVIKVPGKYGPTFYHGEGRDWHKTRAEAILKAKEMQIKKIASLKRQIIKIESLDFS